MPVLTHDCPHCPANSATFLIFQSFQHPGAPIWNCSAHCPACFLPIAVVVQLRSVNQPDQLRGNLADAERRGDAKVLAVFPTRQSFSAPEHTPTSAARAFEEGGGSLSDGRYTSAVAMFRRSLELSLKNFSSEVDAWKLHKRIDLLAEKGLITKDLQTWAHKIRLDGNEAVHEDEEPTKSEAEELQLFTQMVMTYLYTLPAKVKANLPAESA